LEFVVVTKTKEPAMDRPDRLIAPMFEIALSPAEVVRGLGKVLPAEVIYDVLVDGVSWNRQAGVSEEDE